MMNSDSNRLQHLPRQRGASLVVVMLVLLVVTVTGIAGARLALLGEMSARHDRDTQIAFESAEAAIIDAENEIDGVATTACTALRTDKFLAKGFVMAAGTCGNTTADRGLCAPVEEGSIAKPVWATVDFLDNNSTAVTTEYGAFTCRTFDAGSGVKPARAPRYIVERVPDRTPGKQADAFMYRITAMGFGPRVDTRTVVQVEYRKKDIE
jgi:type IV pilus assembly protein PilX